MGLRTIITIKLVALTDRYKKRKTIAGRDLYDIHYFFSQGFNFKEKIIKERTKKSAQKYLEELKRFIKERITQKSIDQDLNFLLPDKHFQAIRKTLKTETLIMINDRLKEYEKSV